MHFMRSIAACAAVALTAQPCFAAEDIGAVAVGERHSAAFAGVNLRLPLGRAGAKDKPSARFQLSMTHEYRDASGSTLRRHQSRGLELGLGGKGTPAYFVGGQKLDQQNARLRMSGGKTTWIIVGGVVVLAVVILAAVASAQPTPGPPPGAFD
jgi:hypothetical protein